MKVGDRVVYKGKDMVGTIAFIGNTQFSEGKWVGVILDEPKGKNNGTVQGKKYFVCDDNYGLFLRPTQIDLIGESSGQTEIATPKGDTGLKKPSTKGRKLENASSVDVTPDATPKVGGIPRPSVLPSSYKPSVAETVSPQLAAPASTLPSTSLPRPSTLGADRKASISQVAAADPLLLGNLGSGLDATAQAEQELVIMNLRDEIADLKNKLDTVELRRQEDRVKLKDYEKCKLQLQALEEYKKRVQEQVTELQKQMLEAKNEKAQIQEAYDRYRDEMSDMAETVELATLDKEMAEEKCETLNSELESLKEKVEELTLELEILKEEAEGKASAEGGFTPLQFKQLEQKNERMVEALVKLRDINYQDKQEISNLQKEIAKLQTEIEHLNKEKERLATDLQKVQGECVELKEHVSAALGAEAMIEDLTAKTLEYEEKLQQLTEERNDLEEMNEMNNEMLETAKETEMELRKDIDHLQVRQSELTRYIEACRDTIAERDRDLMKFREMVCNLNGIIEGLKKEKVVANKQADAVHMQSVQAAAHLANFQVKYAETKALSRVIDGELRQLDVEQGNRHVKLLLPFMPESFLRRGGDHDAILLLLLVARMNAKVGILLTQIRDKYPLNASAPNPPVNPEAPTDSNVSTEVSLNTSSQENVPPPPQTNNDSLGFANYVIYQLNTLRSNLGQFENALNTCGVEQFCKFSTLFPEVLSHESSLDQLLEHLRKDQLDDTVNVDGLERTLAYFHTLYQVHLASSSATNAVGQPLISCSQKMSQLVPCVISAADSVIMDAEHLLKVMESDSCDDISSNLHKLIAQLKEVKTAGRTIRRHLPDKPHLHPLNFSRKVALQINQLVSDLSNLVCILHIANKEARFSMPSEQESLLPSHEIRACLFRAVSRQLQQVNSSTSSQDAALIGLAQRACESVCQLADAMENGEYDFDGTKENVPPAPVTLRANEWRKELAELEATRARIEVKDDEVREVKLSLKLKQEELSEMSVRVSMAEKKLEACTRDSEEKIDRLQQKLDQANAQLKRKEKEFEETMDALQADVDSLEKDKKELEETVKKLRKRNLLEGLGNRPSLPTSSSPAVAHSPTGASAASSEEVMMWKQEADMYRAALENAQAELWREKFKYAKERFDALPPLIVPETTKVSEELNKLERRVREANMELNLFLLNVPFPGPDESQASYKKRVASYALRKIQLKDKHLKLKTELEAYRCQAGLFATAATNFGTFPNSSYNSILDSVRAGKSCEPVGEHIATVKLPTLGQFKPGVYRVPLTSIEQLREVHDALISVSG